MLLLAVRFGDYAAFGDVSSDGSSDGIFVKKLPVAAEEEEEGGGVGGGGGGGGGDTVNDE